MFLNYVARGPHSRPVDNQPTAHRTRECWWTWRGCLVNGERASPHAVGRGPSSPSPHQVGGCGFEAPWWKLPNSVARGKRALRHVEYQPTAHRARAHWRRWRSCLCSQRGARSIPRRWPRLFFNVTAGGRRLQFCATAILAHRSCAALPTRVSPRVEPANRLHSTWALADLT